MKNQKSFLPITLIIVAILFVAGGMNRSLHAQSQPDVASQAEQTGQENPDEPSLLKTQKDQVNYAIGVHFIGNLKKQGIDIDLDLVKRGMQDAFSGKELLLSDADVRRAFMIYHEEVRRLQAKIRTESLEENRKKGEAFLAENGKKEGVITLPSGLQYRIIKQGNGRNPTDSDTVVCRYTGTFIDGEEFDSSYRRGVPANFKVDGAIPGWREALKLMPVGSRWELFVPYQLAFEERKFGGFRGVPGATLIFEMELLGIK